MLQMPVAPDQPAVQVTSIIPFSSAHARRNSVMRTTVLGLLHRMHMNTLDQDVPMLLPVLLSSSAEFERAGYPRNRSIALSACLFEAY
jgi:hypothetical protein